MRFSHLFIFQPKFSPCGLGPSNLDFGSDLFDLLIFELLIQHLHPLAFDVKADTLKCASRARQYNFFQMQTILIPAAFRAVRHQFYESQTLPSSLSLPMASTSNARMKPSSTFMDKVKMKLSSSKSENETFQLFTTYTWPSNKSVRMKL